MTTIEDVKPLDRAKVTGWVRDLFGATNVVYASFDTDDLPRAEVIVKEATRGRIGQELCGLLGLDPATVRSVDLDTKGAHILLSGVDAEGNQGYFVPFED